MSVIKWKNKYQIFFELIKFHHHIWDNLKLRTSFIFLLYFFYNISFNYSISIFTVPLSPAFSPFILLRTSNISCIYRIPILTVSLHRNYVNVPSPQILNTKLAYHIRPLLPSASALFVPSIIAAYITRTTKFCLRHRTSREIPNYEQLTEVEAGAATTGFSAETMTITSTHLE